MHLEPFAMERWQSTYEHQVEINLSESGVLPLRLEELVDTDADLNALLAQDLGYPQSNGSPELRAEIAALYPGATLDSVEVTNGGAEANFLVAWHLLEPGDEIVAMLPNYMQIVGLARTLGARVRPWWLREAPTARGLRWQPDLDHLATLVGPRTKLVALCNPNNPTGARLTEGELDAVAAIAARHGAWIVADEIYRGAELDGRETPSAWGRYERTIVTSGLSKAYGLPGLRIGWVVAPPPVIAQLWAHHDYTTIAPSALSDRLARLALAAPRRARLLDRTRHLLRTNYPVLRAWLEAHGDEMAHIPPEAGAIAFVRYHHAINSTELAERLRATRSVLVVPGDHFEMDGYLRIGYGGDLDQLCAGLARLDELLAAVPVGAAR